MPVICLARHAETTWNAVGKYQGRIDAPLSPLGQAQAQRLELALRDKRIERIIASPLTRAIHTALPLSARTGVRIETDDRLTEIAHGTWEGRYRDEIAQSEPELFWEWREHPERVHFQNGESLVDVGARWSAFVSGFDASKNTLIVTHDIVVRVALLERGGRDLAELRTVHAINAAYAQFNVTDGKWSLVHASVQDHLSGLVADPSRQAL